MRERLTDGKGMRTPVLSRAAWDTAIAAGAVAEVPFAKVLDTGRVYELQRRFDGLLANLLAQLTAVAAHDRASASAPIAAFLTNFAMIVEVETELLGNYAEWLRAYRR